MRFKEKSLRHKSLIKLLIMSPDKIIVIVGGIGLIGFIVWYFLMRPEDEIKEKNHQHHH